MIVKTATLDVLTHTWMNQSGRLALNLNLGHLQRTSLDMRSVCKTRNSKVSGPEPLEPQRSQHRGMVRQKGEKRKRMNSRSRSVSFSSSCFCSYSGSSSSYTSDRPCHGSQRRQRPPPHPSQVVSQISHDGGCLRKDITKEATMGGLEEL